jgi:FkbM family methyltransferase
MKLPGPSRPVTGFRENIINGTARSLQSASQIRSVFDADEIAPRDTFMGPQFTIALAGAYTRRSPLERGKWRIAEYLRRELAKTPFHGIVEVTGGIAMDLATSDFLQREIFIAGDFEPDVRRGIQRILKPGDVFLDIGANVGFFALQAAKAVGPGGKVHAFEPAPKAHDAFKRNLQLNGITNVTSYAVALSDGGGRASLFLDAKNNSGASALHPSPHSGVAIEVELDSYDHFANQNGLPPPALVKIDVEGAEVKVLRGMQALLSRPNRPPVILEVSEWSLKQMGSSKDELYDLMLARGYKAQLISPPGVSIFSGDSIYLQYNVLFTPKDRS